LSDCGIEPYRVVEAGDHAPLTLPNDGDINLWLITGKDQARVHNAGTTRVAIIDYHLNLPAALKELLTSRFPVPF
jgi:hypothetical protein